MTSLLDDVPTEEPTIDPNKNYLDEYVGEGRKFKTPEDLAKSKFHADATIELFKRRMDEQAADIIRLREENAQKAKLEDLVTRLSSREQLASNDQPLVKEVKEQPIDRQQIESLAINAYEKFENQRKQDDNFNTVKTKLIERFGSNYKSAVKEQIDTLGISADEFDAMARKSPKLVLRTLGLDGEVSPERFQAPPRSNRISDVFKPTTPGKRTWSYYQKMKQDNPRLYSDRKTLIQMQQDAIDLGDAFKDGDYNL